ncbi:MAG: DinB family protein [Candidatus Zixiibacteriota bacterium]
MAAFKLNEAIAILRRTPAILRAALEGLDEDWIKANRGESTFSPYDVVGHLIHGERADWIARARMIIEQGESRAFDPFDRFAMYEESRGKSLAELLDTFASLRERNLRTLEGMNISGELLQRRGRHPDFGPVTLEQLLATWAVHDLNHIWQVFGTMAWRYREDVGPWRQYLGILREKQ